MLIVELELLSILRVGVHVLSVVRVACFTNIQIHLAGVLFNIIVLILKLEGA
jgi:hypothetical protein